MRNSTRNNRRDYLPPDRYLSAEQIVQLLNTTKKEAETARRYKSSRGAVNEMIVELMLETGLRAIEICYLQLRDLPSHHGKNVILVRDGKGHLLRTINIKTSLSEKLGRFIKKHRKSAKPGSPLFASERGYRLIHTRKKVKNKIVVIKEHTARLAYQSLYERIKGIGKRAGIPQIFPHMLRHTFGTYLHAVEHDLVNVMYAMGHSRPETTARYARVLNDASIRQAEGLYGFINQYNPNTLPA